MVDVDLEALEAAAGAAEAAATALRDVDVATPFADVSSSLVGSATDQACLWQSTRLGAAVLVFADGVEGLGSAARNVAYDLSATDTRVEGLMGGTTIPGDLDSRLGGPR